MAAITICSDFGAQKIKSDTVSASIWHEVMGQGGGEEIPLIQGKRNPSKTVVVCKRASEGRHTETVITEN